jgi:hypothetical protein
LPPVAYSETLAAGADSFVANLGYLLKPGGTLTFSLELGSCDRPLEVAPVIFPGYIWAAQLGHFVCFDADFEGSCHQCRVCLSSH